MKMRNRIVTIMLAVALVCALLPTVALADTATPSGQHYADVPADAWYTEAVNAMTEGGLLTGYSDGLFHPDDTISVGQFATILCRIGGISTDNNEFKPHELLNVQYETPYDWAHMAIMNLRGLGIYNVRPNQADRLVVRGEAITGMRKIAEVMPQYHENNDRSLPLRQLSERIWTEADIPDWDKVMHANWDNQGPCILAVSIKTAYNLGITQGIDDIGTCNPYGTMTRAELCQMLYNMGITKANSVRYITGFIGM